MRLFSRPVHDLVFLINKNTHDWILGATAREIAARASGNVRIVTHGRKIPASRAYFYANWYSYVKDFHRAKLPQAGLKIVFFTHPRNTPLGEEIVIKAFKTADKIIFMNAAIMGEYLKKGITPSQAVLAPGAADPQFFSAHKRSGNGAIGFCSAYYERKNPMLIYELIKTLPERRFILLGKNWEEFAHFAEMKSWANFTYIDDEYKNYPKYYAQMDVFVSPSFQEGGPIPLVEAMMSNIFPIASMTGFAPDIIEHGRNGFLFDAAAANAADLSALVAAALSDTTTDIRATTGELTWDNFAANVLSCLKK